MERVTKTQTNNLQIVGVVLIIAAIVGLALYLTA